MKKTLKNISYSFFANVVSLGVSILMVMFVPKFLSLQDYGMWQLFLFYYSYLGFLHFGWEDGIYLRYAGKSFEELDAKIFSGQFYGLIFLQIILMCVVSCFAANFIEDEIKKITLICAVGLAVFVNFNNCCNFIMQITNRIKDYAKLMLTERLMLMFLVFSSLFMGLNHFWNMYLSQIGSMVSVSVISFILCRSLLRPKFYPLKDILCEAACNIEVGMKLMFANIASMLILGIVRYGISVGWDVTTFGRVSLTLNISNFFMVFITSVSVVFFPILKTMDTTQLPELYKKIRNMLAILLFGMLIFYYPLKEVLSWWLPKYSDSLIYMSVLFPVCLFESKVSLLINTYFKSMRQEALMLKINLYSVAFAIIMTFLTVGFFHNLNSAVFSIIFLYAFRCELAEYYMERLLNIKLHKDIFVEILMVTIFMISGIIFDSWWCTMIYSTTYVGYLVLNKEKVKELKMELRHI